MTRPEAARQSQPEVFPDVLVAAVLDEDPRRLYDQAPCGLLSTTPDGRIIQVNDRLLSWTGHTRAHLLNRAFSELLSPGGRLYHETHYAPMLRLQGHVREIAFEIVRADGGRLPVLVSADLESDDHGTPLVVRLAVFDATERREYEQELMRATRSAQDSESTARDLARTLQQTLLPPRLPDVDGLELAAAFRAAGEGAEVGGDFYDVFEIGEGDWVVVVGDVCGKGIEAAMLTALIRHTLRAVVVGLHAPRQALAALNEVLLRDASDRFCTVALVRLQRATEGWQASIATAGHPFPLWSRGDDLPHPVGGPGPLVGVLPDAAFEDETVVLRPGETVLLYTDGVTEARGDDGFFGEARLREAFRRHPGPPQATVDGLLAELLAFSGGVPRDDIAMFALRVAARDPEANGSHRVPRNENTF